MSLPRRLTSAARLLLRRRHATLPSCNRVLRRDLSSSSSSSSVDDSLRAALSRVADAVKERDTRAQVLDEDIPGVRSAGPKMVLRFTCTHERPDAPEERTTTKLISKGSYESGIVVVRCDCCDKQHLIADNLGWFGERTNIEATLAARGEQVQRYLREGDDGGELLHVE